MIEKIFPVRFAAYRMSHWGELYILPELVLSIVYSMSTVSFKWWVFRVDLIVRRRLPDWFMKYVWGPLNLDFLDKKEEDDE